MRARKCFRCGKDLRYSSYIKNWNPDDIEHLTEIWECDYIELFCCHCYSFKTKYQPNIDTEKNAKYIKIN